MKLEADKYLFDINMRLGENPKLLRSRSLPHGIA